MKRKWTSLLVLLLATTLLMSGCVTKSTYNKTVEELNARVDSLEEQLGQVTEEKTQLEDQLDQALSRGWLGDKALVYFVFDAGEDWYLVPVARDVEFSKDTDPRRTAMEELIAGPGPGSTLSRSLPEGVRVSSLSVDDNGLATVDLSREVLDINAGAAMENLAVAAIVNTLTEFPEVDRVQILVGGQTIETLAGHVDISKPLERNESVILK